jgi:hypothetical protein
LHDFKNQEAFRSLHNQFDRAANPRFPVNQKIWNQEQKEYWKWRAKNDK